MNVLNQLSFFKLTSSGYIPVIALISKLLVRVAEKVSARKGITRCLVWAIPILNQTFWAVLTLEKDSSDFIMLWTVEMETSCPSLGKQSCHRESLCVAIFF